MFYKCIGEKTLDCCPDCIAIFKNTHIVVSSYDYVDKDTQKGVVLLLNLQLEQLDKLDCAGILDFKIRENIIIACTVNSQVLFIQIDYEQNKLKMVNTVNIDGAVKLLYLDVKQNELLLGGDNGEVIHYYNQQQTKPTTQHSYSVWCTAFDDVDQNTYYSGSDDMLLLTYDQRIGDSIRKDSKSHTQGITYILSQQNDLITGCFDGYLRFFDKRQMGHAYQEFKRSGGIWRIIKRDNQYLNALFTEKQYEIVSIKDDKLEVLQTIEGHDSLAYGMDWNGEHIATLSFYDKLIKIHSI